MSNLKTILSIDTVHPLYTIAIINSNDVVSETSAQKDEKPSEQIIELIGCDKEDILSVSAKEGLGIEDVFESIISKIPKPTNLHENKMSRGLIFDSFYDQFRGVVAYVRVFGGKFKKNDIIELVSNKVNFEITEVGKLKLEKVKTDTLSSGDVGYIVTSLKDVADINVGDTVIIHHNVFRRWYDQRGVERNSSSYFKEDL